MTAAGKSGRSASGARLRFAGSRGGQEGNKSEIYRVLLGFCAMTFFKNFFFFDYVFSNCWNSEGNDSKCLGKG